MANSRVTWPEMFQPGRLLAPAGAGRLPAAQTEGIDGDQTEGRSSSDDQEVAVELER